jgi:hypothetical protein
MLAVPRYWTTGTVSANSLGGMRTFASGSTATTGVAVVSTYRSLATDGVSIFVAYSSSNNSQTGLVRMSASSGGGWPLTNAVSLCNVLTGCLSTGAGSSRAPGTSNAVFEAGTPRLWMGDTTNGINLFTLAANGTYVWTASYRGPGGETFRALAGRASSAGVFYLVAVQNSAPAPLWHFNPATAAFTRIGTSLVPGTLYKGVAPAPYSASVRQPSRTAAPTVTPPPTATPSNTPTGSLTPSISMTASVTPPATVTPTITSSPSGTASDGSSQSPSPSATATPTVSPFPGLSADSLLVLRVCGGPGDTPYTSVTALLNTTCRITVGARTRGV